MKSKKLKICKIRFINIFNIINFNDFYNQGKYLECLDVMEKVLIKKKDLYGEDSDEVAYFLLKI